MAKGGGDGVNIPVNVTGSEEAKAKLGQVGQSVQNLDAAAQQAGGKQKSLGEQAGKAADSLENLGGVSERTVKQFIGTFNPAMAQTVDAILDLVSGIKSLNPVILVLIAVAAAVALITDAFQQAARAANQAREATERLHEAEKKRRGEAIKTRSEVAEELAGAGINPDQADAAMKRAAELNDPKRSVTVSQELALNAALAEQLAAKFGVSFTTDQYLAGVAVSGAKPIKFGDTDKEQKAILLDVLNAGATPQAAQMRDNLLRQQNEEAKRHALPADLAKPVGSADRYTTLLLVAKDSGQWSDEELKAAEARLRDYEQMSRTEQFFRDNPQAQDIDRSMTLSRQILREAGVMRGRPFNTGGQGFEVNDPMPEREPKPKRERPGQREYSPPAYNPDDELVPRTVINIGTGIFSGSRRSNQAEVDLGSAVA